MEMFIRNVYNNLAIVALILAIVFGYFKWCFTFWNNRNVYTPQPSVPFGNAKKLLMQKRSLGEEFKDIYDIVKGEGKRYGGYYIATKPIFVPVDLDLIKRIMITDFDHFTDRIGHVDEEADPLAGNLFNLSGLKWKHLRAKLTPTFTPGKMKMMFHTVTNYSEELTKVVADEIKANRALNMRDILARFAIDVIGSCGFGLECNTLKNPDTELKKYTEMIFGCSLWDSVVRLLSFTTPEILDLLKLRTFKREVHEFFANIVKQTVSFREENNVVGKDFMHLLIQIKNNVEIRENDLGDIKNKSTRKTEQCLSLNEMAAQAFVFFTGGFETSSSTMSYCLYELAQNLNIQEKVRDEINMILEKYGEQLTYEGVNEMTYLENCIFETLRKYPILPVTTRKCTKTYKVPDSELILQKNTFVFIPAMGIHYDPDYYPDPERFDPKRFSGEHKANRRPCAWIPFGEGPRICIGARFGMMQVKVALAALLKNFRFRLNAQTRLPLVMNPRALSLSPRSKIWLNAEQL